MATPSSSALHSPTFPPEILLHILSFASESYSGHHYADLNQRNADLASLALVSRTFQAGTYPVLYGDLRLAWMADKVKKLQKSFQTNAHLVPLVRRLEATTVRVDEYIVHQLRPRDDAALEERAWLEGYLREEGIEEDSQEWLQVFADGFEDSAVKNSALREAWTADTMRDARYAWDRNGHGTWAGRENQEGPPEGARELLDVIASAPALRSLLVRGFTRTLDATDMATRGPYPLIESLEAPRPSAPAFLVNHTLPSFLASSTPNLRSLAGHVEIARRHTTPAITLPPSLTRLDILGIHKGEPRIDALLLHLQPNLRSLTLTPTSPGWAYSLTLAVLLSSLESFALKKNPYRDHAEDNKCLARALAPSSSLRHLELELVPATSTLIAALPASLRSITLVHHTFDDESPRPEMERVLKLLEAAATQPLRVEFATAVEWQGRLAWEECRDAYAAKGHTLSVRCWK